MLAAARDAADAAAHAVEKMRVSERAATKAYDVASSRERVLRDEMEKAASENSHGGGHDDGAENETWRCVQDAKNTADWAAGPEEQAQAHERVVEEARARLAAAEDHVRDVMRQDGDEYGEFKRISEALERTGAPPPGARGGGGARVAAVASVDASHKLRVASERLDEMTGKMQRKERELADAERDIDAATREAQAAMNEAREAEAREGELAREHAALPRRSLAGRRRRDPQRRARRTRRRATSSPQCAGSSRRRNTR